MTKVDPELKAAHERSLKEAAATYRKAKVRADQILAEPRQRLADAVRAAFSADLKKSEIIRAADHVWSRQWIDHTVKGDTAATEDN
jgi:hypothetical protein